MWLCSYKQEPEAWRNIGVIDLLDTEDAERTVRTADRVLFKAEHGSKEVKKVIRQ